MSSFSLVNKILTKETEEWLSYLYFQDLDHIKNCKPRYSGAFIRCCAFFFKLFYFFIFSLNKSKYKGNKIDFYIYAGTANEANSLVSTAKALSEKNKVVSADSRDKLLLNGANNVFEFNQLDLQIRDILLAIILFLYNAPIFYLRLRKKNPLLANKFFNGFCEAYLYLPVFYRILRKHQPNFILVSNDHNVDCRSLLAVAYALDIKTIYMQHASVSNIFPALTVSYAFLDGNSALNTYLECESNLSSFYKDRTLPKIFLTGQKKILNKIKSKSPKKIGLAINSLDHVDKVIELVNRLVDKGFKLILRWHPDQKYKDIVSIENKFLRSKMVTLSYPQKEVINDYLAKISHIISGNSSIHLEAAIFGVIPIYYEIQPSYINDYYGYVRNGLAYKLESFEDLIIFLNKDLANKTNVASIQYYSATYNTEWEGKEGELVANILIDIQIGKPWINMFGAIEYSVHE